MASRTYAPQYVRKLRELALYVTRHSGKMSVVMSSAEIATFAQIQAAAAVFDSVDLSEEP